MKNKETNPYQELKKELIIAIDSLVGKEAKKLEKAIKRDLLTGDNPGEAFLLLNAGLVRCIGDYGSIHSSEYCFAATPRGIELYKNLERRLNRG
jgi:hypothetical protein